MCFKRLSPNDLLFIISYYSRRGIFIIWTDSYLDLPNKLNELSNSIYSKQRLIVDMI